MKNQYYGDINDFIKYGILRHLCAGGSFALGVNWYLTADDASNDGNITEYLSKPDRWRSHDPELFDHLYESVINNSTKDVSGARQCLGGEGTVFYDAMIPDGSAERDSWHAASMKILGGCDLLFLDPDNGLSVKSVPYGKRNSSKFAYDHEMLSVYERGKRSLVLYQHFPRIKRDVFLDHCCKRLSDLLGGTGIVRLKTRHVVFFVIPASGRELEMAGLCQSLGRRWHALIEYSLWSRSPEVFP